DLPDDERNLLLNQIQSSVERLGQLRNVGWAWGWYESMGNDPYATARVLNALADAKTIGITLNSSAFEDAVRYLSSFVRVPGVNTPSDELNNQAQIMYTLSQYDAITLDSLNALYEYRLEMSIAARALLLSAFL